MGQPRRSYTKAFKLDVVQQSYECDNIRQLAKELGITAKNIYKWRGIYGQQGETAFPGHGNQQLSTEQAQIKKLQAQNQELRLERDILKKAIGIFGKTNG